MPPRRSSGPTSGASSGASRCTPARSARPAGSGSVATAGLGIAEVSDLIGNSDESVRAGERAVAIWRALVHDHPGRRDYRQHLAEAEHMAAIQLRMARRPDESLQAFRRADALWKSL